MVFSRTFKYEDFIALEGFIKVLLGMKRGKNVQTVVLGAGPGLNVKRFLP